MNYTYVVTFCIGMLVGGGLTWAFRGWIQHRKDAVAGEIKKIGG